jgi:hypothetical protein
MPLLNPDSHPWSLVSIRAHAPAGSGIYAIFAEHWIYVGQGDDIQARLLSHFWGKQPCIRQHRPLGFTFELVPYMERTLRLAQLREELKPLCDPPAGLAERTIEASATPEPRFFEPTEPLSRTMLRRLNRWWSEQRRRKLVPS